MIFDGYYKCILILWYVQIFNKLIDSNHNNRQQPSYLNTYARNWLTGLQYETSIKIRHYILQ